MTTSGNWITIAHLLRPQGRRGELLAEVLTDFPGRFTQTKGAFLVRRADARAEAQPVILEGHWLHKGRVVLKFQGVDSITAAEKLRGLDLVISQEQRVPLSDGSVYIDDLIGCLLVDTNQAGAPVVGVIRDVIPQPQTVDLLVVEGGILGSVPGNAASNGPSNGPSNRKRATEHLIPFAKAFLVRMDMAARRVEMALPVGLLTVNAPLTPEEQSAMAASQPEENPKQ